VIKLGFLRETPNGNLLSIFYFVFHQHAIGFAKMQYKSYSYKRDGQLKFTFVSIGKQRIVKAVIFTSTEYQSIMNLGFGDLMPDGTIDDAIDSNNGDMTTVLATVIQIMRTFMFENPRHSLFFKGSTPQRTLVYERIIKTYYETFSLEFNITALVQDEIGYRERSITENPETNVFAFLVKKIN